MPKDLEKVDETVDIFLTIFGNKWNLLVMYELFKGPRRFNELKKALDPISSNVLVRHLRTLMNMKMVDKIVTNSTPVSIIYALSETGFAVIPSMISTYGWIIDNFPLVHTEE